MTGFADFTANGQPVLWGALERLAEEILRSVVDGAFCTVQDWDDRIDCCIRLDDGSVVGEMVPLASLDAQVLRAVGGRLGKRRLDADYPLGNELCQPIRILRSRS